MIKTKEERIRNCKDCTGDDSTYRTAYNNDDNIMFESRICIRSCTTGIVPNHIPVEQVIRYMKHYNI